MNFPDLIYYLIIFLLILLASYLIYKIYEFINNYLNQYYFPNRNFSKLFPEAKLVYTNTQTVQMIQPEFDFEKESLKFKPNKVLKNITRTKGRFNRDKNLLKNVAFVNDLASRKFKVYDLNEGNEIQLSDILYSYEPEYGCENKFYISL